VNPRDWRRAVERNDRLAEQRRARSTEEETDMTELTTTGLTVDEIALSPTACGRSCSPPWCPPGMVLDGPTKLVIDDALHELVVSVGVAIIGQPSA
jgi:hypothetical protein